MSPLQHQCRPIMPSIAKSCSICPLSSIIIMRVFVLVAAEDLPLGLLRIPWPTIFSIILFDHQSTHTQVKTAFRGLIPFSGIRQMWHGMTFVIQLNVPVVARRDRISADVNHSSSLSALIRTCRLPRMREYLM